MHEKLFSFFLALDLIKNATQETEQENKKKIHKKFKAVTIWIYGVHNSQDYLSFFQLITFEQRVTPYQIIAKEVIRA